MNIHFQSLFVICLLGVAYTCNKHDNCETCIQNGCAYVEKLNGGYRCVLWSDLDSPVKKIYRSLSRCATLTKKLQIHSSSEKISTISTPPIQTSIVSIDVGLSTSSPLDELSSTSVSVPSQTYKPSIGETSSALSSFDEHELSSSYDDLVHPDPTTPKVVVISGEQIVLTDVTTVANEEQLGEASDVTPKSELQLPSTTNPPTYNLQPSTMNTQEAKKGKEYIEPRGLMGSKGHLEGLALGERALRRKIKRDACKLARDFVVYKEIHNLGSHWWYFAVKNPMNLKFKECNRLLRRGRKIASK